MLSDGNAFKRSTPYDRYAEVYDAIGQRDFGERIAEATLNYLSRIGRVPHAAVDLACGTGAATLALAAHGISVTGIDRSAAMLSVARKTAENGDLSVSWLEQDIRDAEIEEPVDLVTCFYDSLNYMVEESDLAHVFARVRDMLTAKGIFVFDLNTKEKFGAAWNNSCYVAIDRAEIFGIYQSWYEAKTGLSPLILTFFLRDADGKWDRFDEEHIERAYELADVEAILLSEGFKTEALLDYRDRAGEFGAPATEQSHRVVFIATPLIRGWEQ